MKIHAFRLTKGQDLKKEIVQYVKQHQIQSGTILSGVGCLYEVNIRLAKGKKYYTKQEDYEITSLMGTLSLDGVHLHITLCDENLQVIGGHLEEGCLVNTTAEIVLLEGDLTFKREFDASTGYKELVVGK